MDRFSQAVIEKLGFYVYRLIDPRNGETFYVGKGKGHRVFDHVKGAVKEADIEKDENGMPIEDNISLKTRRIKEILNDGLQTIHVIQRWGLTEKVALEVEAALIDCFPGLTNIQDGHSADRGVNNAEVLERVLSVEEFQDDEDLKYCIIKIKDYWIDAQGAGDIYETVRKYWRVNLSRVQKIPYVLAVKNGIVVEVFKVQQWYRSDMVPDRCMFDGVIAPEDIRNRFKDKRLPGKYIKKGMASPILYHD